MRRVEKGRRKTVERFSLYAQWQDPIIIFLIGRFVGFYVSRQIYTNKHDKDIEVHLVGPDFCLLVHAQWFNLSWRSFDYYKYLFYCMHICGWFWICVYASVGVSLKVHIMFIKSSWWTNWYRWWPAVLARCCDLRVGAVRVRKLERWVHWLFFGVAFTYDGSRNFEDIKNATIEDTLFLSFFIRINPILISLKALQLFWIRSSDKLASRSSTSPASAGSYDVWR